MEHRWTPREPDLDQVEHLQRQLELEPLAARLLVNRGLSDPEVAWRFLHPQFSDLHDPFLMRDMDVAIGRIQRALDQREKILIYGDYDVDGITSTVALRRALQMLGGEASCHIPRRLEDGYGLRKDVFRRAREDGISLVISVDSGIRDFEVCEYARELALDLIVTDHHLPSDRLPEATAILNPRRADCPYPDKNLAAVGVVMKLVQALFGRHARAAVLPHFLKIVAIGTVADMVPLTGENRTIVKLGLASLRDARNVGLQALLAGSGVGPTVDHFDVGFKLAPRINAFTRMGGGAEILDLFSVEDAATAEGLVREMNEKNLQRRAEEERILEEIVEDAERRPLAYVEPFIVAAGRGWHRGVIGNVAARAVQRFYRPSLVLSLTSDGAQGSGRSVPGFHLLEALESCADCFDRFGGHSQAVGCTLKREFANEEGVGALGERLRTFAAARLTPDLLIPEVPIDAVLPIESLTLSMCEQVELLAPYGIGNPVPVFSSNRVTVLRGPWVLKERHLKLQARANGTPVEVIWWRHGEMAENLAVGSSFDLAYSVSRNSYLGQNRILLTVKDLRV